MVIPVGDDAFDYIFRAHIIARDNVLVLAHALRHGIRVGADIIRVHRGGAVHHQIDIKMLHQIRVNRIRGANDHLGCVSLSKIKLIIN